MEDSAQDTTLVVSEREFLVNRKELVEKSSYFKAMLGGSFVEAGLNRVKLTGIEDPVTFSVILEYILTKRTDLKVVLQVLKPVLVLADMINEDSFKDCLKQELFSNWSCLENAQDILQFGEALGITTSLLRRIFYTLKNTFIIKGGKKLYGTKFIDPKDCCFSLVNNSPDLVVALCGTELATFLLFPDNLSRLQQFIKGVTSWIVHQKLDETSVRKIVRCFGVQNMNQKDLLFALPLQSESKLMDFLKQEINYYVKESRATFRKYVSRVSRVGWRLEKLELIYFNAEKWKWDAIDLIESCTSSSDEQNIQMENTEEPVKCSMWYTENKDFLSSSCTGGPFNEPFYCSESYYEDTCTTIVILELKSGEKRFSTIFKSTIKGRGIHCSLRRLDDVLHGFLTYSEIIGEYNVCHFALQRNREEDTWCDSELRLEPLLWEENIGSYIIPVATSISEGGVLVMFKCDLEYLWVTLYNVQSGILQPLQLLPIYHPPYAARRVEIPKYKFPPGFQISSDTVFDDSATRACTFFFLL